MKKDIENAVKALKGSGIVIFPTDTAFGVGCRINNSKAVKKLFKIRRRSETKAVPVLASSIGMVKEYVDNMPRDVLQLVKKYWPGGLTVILKSKKRKIPPFVRGGGDTIGIRIPNHDTMLKIIDSVGVPILAPSANFPGGATPHKKEDLDPALASLVDVVVDGECSLKAASTVIDCSKKPWKILRQGAVKVEL